MEPKASFHGCYVATLTPFDASGTPCKVTLREHIAWMLARGVEGLCPVGTTGEFLYLSQIEKMSVIGATLDAVAGRVPVIAGVWAWEAADRTALAQFARRCGASAVFLPTPIYYPADDETIYRWYAEVKAATELPVFAYNIPQYAANEISLDCLQRLFDTGVIAGVKDSSGKAERVGALVERFGAQRVVFAASDGFASEGRRLGADGFISAIANVYPRLFSQLWAGDDSRQSLVNELRTTLKRVGSISALKYLLTRQGFPFGTSRLPFSELTSEQQTYLEKLSTDDNMTTGENPG